MGVVVFIYCYRVWYRVLLRSGVVYFYVYTTNGWDVRGDKCARAFLKGCKIEDSRQELRLYLSESWAKSDKMQKSMGVWPNFEYWMHVVAIVKKGCGWLESWA